MTFARPNDSAEFVGLISDTAFDSVEIRETVGGIENEYFGEFYTSATAVPEPSAFAFLALVAGATGAVSNRRRRNTNAEKTGT